MSDYPDATPMPRLTDKQIATRRAKVYKGIVAGKAMGQIRAELGVSDDTVARDLAAVGDDLLAWAKQELTGTLAFVVANYKLMILESWEGYQEECRRERDWLAGKYDRAHDAPDLDGGTHRESRPPPFRVLKVAWFNSMRKTLMELTKVAGLTEDRVARLLDLDAAEDDEGTDDLSGHSDTELRALIARRQRERVGGTGAA